MLGPLRTANLRAGEQSALADSPSATGEGNGCDATYLQLI